MRKTGWSEMFRRRPTGPPQTASSFHLWWSLPTTPGRALAEVSATLEVLTAPAVPYLYFWALQVSFLGPAGRRLGAAHTGLQWHPGSPGGAVNWGGYHEGGAELSGTRTTLAPVDSANTLRWPWEPGTPYRFRVSSPGAGRWRAEVTDPAQGRTEILRDLFVDAVGLGDPVCWSEVFAPCDAPSACVRWSGLHAVDDHGDLVNPVELRPNYQAPSAGGCPNTESVPDPAGGVVQTTGLAGPRARERARHVPYAERSAR